MRRRREPLRLWLMAAIASVRAGIAAPVPALEPVAVAFFFAPPAIGKVCLSPSGNHLALTVVGKDGRRS